MITTNRQSVPTKPTKLLSGQFVCTMAKRSGGKDSGSGLLW